MRCIVGLLLFSACGLTSCLSPNDIGGSGGGSGAGGNGSSSGTVAAIGFFHGAVDSPAVLVGVDNPGSGNTLNFGLFSGYTTYSAAPHRVTFSSATNSKVTLVDTTLTYQAQTTYTLFLYNPKNGGAKTVLATDYSGPLGQNNAGVRFAHLAASVPDVKVLIVGQTKQIAEQQTFLDVSPFAEYLALQGTLEVRAVSDNHLVISKVWDPLPGKFYTAVLTGPTNAPKLTIIENK